MDNFLKELEKDENLSEFQIYKKIQEFIFNNNLNNHLQYESIAFAFREDNNHYFPLNDLLDFPSLNDINKDSLKYWESRIKESSNQTFITRYSGLVWEFHELVYNKKANYKIAEIHIKSLLNLVKKRKGNYITKIKRALYIANILNFKDCISNIKIAIIDLENYFIENKLFSDSAFSLDLIDEYERLKFSKKEEKELLKNLNNYYSSLILTTETYYLENFARRLANYYTKHNNFEAAKKVLISLTFTLNEDSKTHYINIDSIKISPKNIIPNKKIAIERSKKDKDDSFVLYDSSNRVISTLSSKEDRIVWEYSKLLLEEDNSAIFENDFIEYFKKSPFFTNDNIKIIEKGLESYYKNDYLSAINILITQIDAIARNIVEMNGGIAIKPGKHGGYQIKSLGGLLRDDIFKELFSEEVQFYLLVLLTDQRGWNLRNNISHGILSYDDFNLDIANRLLNVLLIFAV